MNYETDRHHRSSTRLKGYDYSEAGAYFVTVCTQNRECLFGDVVDGEMRLNGAGQMVHNVWNDLSPKYPDIETDEFVVMPNHFHWIIVIVGAPLVGALENRAGTRPAPTRGTKTVQSYRPAPTRGTKTVQSYRSAPTLGDIVGAFKSTTIHQYTDGVRQKNWPAFNGRFWQRNYYEHIIRGEEEMHRIRRYIIENPAKWADDEDNPANIRGQK